MKSSLLIAFFGIVPFFCFAQSFQSTEGNSYSGKVVSGTRENDCITETIIDRRVNVSRDLAAQRLTFTMEVNKSRDAVYRGRNKSDQLECDPGRENSSAVVRFYIDSENANSTKYSGTVISASKSIYGFKLGERIYGQIEVYDGGRGLDFSGEDFTDGVARVLATSFKNAAGPEQANFSPSRSPDIILACKVIASDGTGTISNASSSNQKIDSNGRVSTTQSNSSSSSTNSACLANGWQNIRKNISIWIQEKRCDGQKCEISPTNFQWGNSNLSRVSGQLKDSCYTYECEKAASNQVRF
jgi:hypothetical protein